MVLVGVGTKYFTVSSSSSHYMFPLLKVVSCFFKWPCVFFYDSYLVFSHLPLAAPNFIRLLLTDDGRSGIHCHAWQQCPGIKRTSWQTVHEIYVIKPKFHLARHVSILHDSTRSTCRAHAFWLCRARRTARLDTLDMTSATGVTRNLVCCVICIKLWLSLIN